MSSAKTDEPIEVLLGALTLGEGADENRVLAGGPNLFYREGHFSGHSWARACQRAIILNATRKGAAYVDAAACYR